MGGVWAVSQTGNDLLDALAALGIVCGALSAIALAAKKPPLRWIGHWLAWVFRRLLGDPIAGWLARETNERVTPIVRTEIAPVIGKVDDLAADVKHLHRCIEGVKDQADEIVERGEADRAALKRTADDTNRKVSELRAEMDERGERLTKIEETLEHRGQILDRAAPLIDQAEPLLAEARRRLDWG